MRKLVDWVLNVAWKIPPLSRTINRHYIHRFSTCTPPRPRCYSLWSHLPKPDDFETAGAINDYASWPSLTDRRFSGLHLPPADASFVARLPHDAKYDYADPHPGKVTSLFARAGDMTPSRSSLLFMFFAQWFTDSILRIDPFDRRKNTSNHDIDLCQIYGLHEHTTALLRSRQGGMLRSHEVNGEEMPDYLGEVDANKEWQPKAAYKAIPYIDKLQVVLAGFPAERWEKLYATGLERGNSSIGYVAISTLFLREHNRICRVLAKEHPAWDDERLFQTARMINIVLLLRLIVEEYINHILGHKLFRLDTEFAEDRNWYRANWMALEFDLLYRWHGLVPDRLMVNNTTYEAEAYRNNNALLEEVGLGPILSSASQQRAGKIGLLNTPSFLMGAEHQSIKMSRDFRLRGFNEYRERFGLKRLRTFQDLTADRAVQERLSDIYRGDIDTLELVIGLFAEDAEPGQLFGSLMTRMVAYDAFTQIFSNPLISRNVYHSDTFTDYGLSLIAETTSLKALVARNVRNAESLTVSFGASPPSASSERSIAAAR
jgi:prostaglandin-endoperoxide synthase 2